MKYLVLLLFFISGACGLVYEVVWSRDFVLVLGGTTHAVSAVVAAFMAGLGLGGILGGRMIDRGRLNPLAVYGCLEGGVGALALLVPVLVRLTKPLLAWAFAWLGGSAWPFQLLRFVLSAAILFPPTLLMGATLPVLVKATLQAREQFGSTAGRLYAVNTVGAMAGAGLAGFVLLPALGDRITLLIAAALNLTIGAVALASRRRFASGAPAGALAPVPAAAGRPRSMVLSAVLAGYGLSGLAALVFQIAWTRSLALTLGGSTYSFSLILAAYIGGLGLGGALALRWVDRLRRPMLAAAVIEFAIGISAVAVLPLLDNVNLAMYEWLWRLRQEARLISLVRCGVTFGLIAVPTMAMGALLPLVARVAGRERPGAGGPMGLVYSANTAGAVAGTFLAGYVLLDWIGVRPTLLLATGLCLAVGFGWMLACELPRRQAWLGAVLGAVAGTALILRLPVPDPLVINSGPYMYSNEVVTKDEGTEGVKQALNRYYRVLYAREDGESSVMVAENREGMTRILRINGKTDASNGTDMANQLLLAHLPLLFHPHPRSVMVIGLASGVTAGAALRYPIQSLDCLELSPAVAEASRYFESASGLNYNDPRFHLILTDARNYLELSPRTYDVIISEPSNPWQAGEGLLFTHEFFELARSRLNPGGMMVAWIDVYNYDSATLKMMLRTFTRVFPHVSLWETWLHADYVLIGTNGPQLIDYQLLQDRASGPVVASTLDSIQAGPLGILSRFVMDEKTIANITGPGPIHTDDRRQLEFEMPRTTFTPYRLRLPGLLDSIFSHHQDVAGMIKFPAGGEGKRVKEELARQETVKDDLLWFERRQFDPATDRDDFIARSLEMVRAMDDRYPSKEASGELASYILNYAVTLHANGKDEETRHLLEQAYELDPANGRSASLLALVLLEGRDLDGAEAWALKSEQKGPVDYQGFEVLARVARERGDLVAERKYRLLAFKVWPQALSNRLALARVLEETGHEPEAFDLLVGVLHDHPDNADAHFFLALVLVKGRQWDDAEYHFKRALALDPNHPSAAFIRQSIEEIEKGRMEGH